MTLTATERDTATGMLREAGIKPSDIAEALIGVEKLAEFAAVSMHDAAAITSKVVTDYRLNARTFTRTGFAGITMFGLLFSVSNFHASRPDLRWTTGINADIGPWKKDPYRSWFIEVSLLGFNVGVCSNGQRG